ncbi:MAG: hypothetical protein KAJ48_09400 [Elusimicrobiales bacterium]|nr:hypothetical protein [Elusimicrobiales bacterium]
MKSAIFLVDFLVNIWYNSSMTIHEFIKKRKYLIWYVSDYDALDAESIVEATLNYGDWDDVQKLIKIIGIKKMAKIFHKQTHFKSGRCNYDKVVKHYFKLYFDKYA